ncbi:hypothetical protein H2201_003310 [Coniosporium apollinis]|uniref:Aminotransferase class I/classII large domain-containing protein n=2 Tax=Coniosporium TaxID=2810619 RepID=A0ABQ9P020_9PEZI|nr:hypothetical protein H2199_008642 [Cladosporium sp. JES 115]KAJ9666651.1 hypothetical protein H2201_003310 [Coniosporium apollinis]
MTIKKSSTLGRRGAALASQESIRDKFGTILADPYDPDTNPSGFINIGTAENYIMLSDAAEFANKHIHLSGKNFSYGEGPWGTKRLRRAMTAHMTKYFHPHHPLHEDDLLFANGCTSLMEMLGFSLMDPGDGILLTRPCYIAFALDFGTKAAVQPVFVSFGDVDQFSVAAIPCYEAALSAAQEAGITVRALMLCHPHNPLGQCYPRATLEALMQFCQRHNIHMIADEIYALSVYDIPDPKAVAFESVLSFDTTPYISNDYLHVMYGLSKDTAAGGLRLGVVYLRNKELMRAMSAVTQFHWPGAADEKIAIAMLEDREWMAQFLETSRGRLAEGNKLTRSLLEEMRIPFRAGANAGFFIWADLRRFLKEESGKWLEGKTDGWEAEKVLSKRLIEEKVFIMDGGSQAAEEPGFFRIIFSHDERTMREGLRRVGKAIRAKE